MSKIPEMVILRHEKGECRFENRFGLSDSLESIRTWFSLYENVCGSIAQAFAQGPSELADAASEGFFGSAEAL